MIEKSLNEMSYDEFQALIDGYIERSSRQTGEMPASVFFELLFERLAARVRQTVEVTGRIVGKELVLSLSRPESVPVQSDFRRRSADRGEIGARFADDTSGRRQKMLSHYDSTLPHTTTGRDL